MNVQVWILFAKPGEQDWQDMRSLGNQLTNDRGSVKVHADPEQENWLVVEFTMPTEAQYKAVGTIDRALRFTVENREDSRIRFPRR